MPFWDWVKLPVTTVHRMAGLPFLPLLTALGSYLFTYYHAKVTKEREAQIDRVNAQVRLLYGPLLACVTATKSAFDAMVHQHSPDGSVDEFVKACREHPDGEVGKAYRQWMREVLQPLNEKAADIIVTQADLLESSTIEPILLHLVAHVSANKVILSRWKEGDIHQFSAISYPDKLLQYIERETRNIKAQQAKLLGITNGDLAKSIMPAAATLSAASEIRSKL